LSDSNDKKTAVTVVRSFFVTSRSRRKRVRTIFFLQIIVLIIKITTMKYGFRGRCCSRHRAGFMRSYNKIYYNILQMPNTHKNHWIIYYHYCYCVCGWLRFLQTDGGNARAASARWKKNIWSPGRPVSRAHACASHQPPKNTSAGRRFWKLYYYASCGRLTGCVCTSTNIVYLLYYYAH